MVQIIKCLCGAIIAGCSFSKCDEDEDWKESVNEYQEKGYVVEMITDKEISIESCSCNSEQNILKFLMPIHTHAEIVFEENPSQIVYREKDIIELIKQIIENGK